MSRLIGIDRMVSATNSKMQPLARDAKSSAHPLIPEQSVNTVIDRKPQDSSVPSVMSSFHDVRSSNQRREGKAGQTWSPEAPFLNAHAFPDNPLRSAEDFLLR